MRLRRRRHRVSHRALSDTHGRLRPEAIAALRGCDHIVHRGDFGNHGIIEQLGELVPLTVVRGNNDTGAWAATLPETVLVELIGIRVHVLHDLARLDLHAPAAGLDVVVSGHSHRPRVTREAGVLYVNPGSAGRRRFRLPATVGKRVVAGAAIDACIALDLDGGGAG